MNRTYCSAKSVFICVHLWPIRNPQSAIRNAAGCRANGMKSWRRIAIRRYGCLAFVPHADYLIIDSNFCQALVAKPNRAQETSLIHE
jgi:hypothetical protein